MDVSPDQGRPNRLCSSSGPITQFGRGDEPRRALDAAGFTDCALIFPTTWGGHVTNAAYLWQCMTLFYSCITSNHCQIETLELKFHSEKLSPDYFSSISMRSNSPQLIKP